MNKLICAVAILAVSTAQADTIYVDANCPGGDGSELDPYCSIQTAIDNAVDTDEIVVAPGTYFESIDFLGKAITLRSADGAEVTIIDGTGFFHVVVCRHGEGPDTILDGFTITGGNANGNGDDRLGGGMCNVSSSLTVTNCTFSGNSALSGGGMYNGRSSPTVTNCTFSENTADHVGGGMCNVSSSPTVTNCTFSENWANCGGGMFNLTDLASSPTVTNCILWGDSPDEIRNTVGLTVTYSDVQGGWPGTGNIDADPLFADPDNGDLHLLPGSPCIDAADNTAVPPEITTDLDGNPRFVDDPYVVDTGIGDPPIVDMGAYELCLWDCGGDHDGNVGIVDFLGLLSQWDQVGTTCDFGLGDPGVGISEFLDVLANWGPCP